MISEYKSIYLNSFPFDGEEYFDKIIATIDPSQFFYAEENDRVVSGCYLRKFDFIAKDKKIEISVLGGVCTEEEKRGKGIAGIVIGKALNYLHKEGQPFCFLHPARYDYYKRYGFIGIENGTDVKLNGTEDCTVVEICKSEASNIANFIAKINKKTDFYVLCHTHYIENCFDEAVACNGNVYKMSAENMTAYVFISGSTIDHVFTDNVEKFKQIGFVNGLKFSDYSGNNPDYIQGRITCVTEALRLVVPTKPFKFNVRIVDPIVAGNNQSLSIISDGVNINIEQIEEVDFEVSIDKLFFTIIFGSSYNYPIKPKIQNKY